MNFDLDAARKAGLSDSAIAQELAKRASFDYEGARKAGFSDSDIAVRLASGAPPATATTAPAPPSIIDRLAGGAREQTAGAMQAASRLLPGATDMRRMTDDLASRAVQDADAMSERVEGMDWARLIGGAGATAPLLAIGGAPATLGRMALMGAAQGAAAGVVAPVDVSQGQDYAEAKVPQILAGTVGGAVLTPLGAKAISSVASLASKAVQGVRDRVAGGAAMSPQQIETAITGELTQQGVDWASFSPEVKAAVMADVQKALKPGTELDTKAAANAAVLKQAGVDNPTRGQVTQDASQFQNELYLRGQETGKPLLDQVGAARESLRRGVSSMQSKLPQPLDNPSAGAALMAPITAADKAAKAEVTRMYEVARGMAGRATPINGSGLANRVYPILEQRDAVAGLPEVYDTMLKQLTEGKAQLTIGRASEIIQNINDKMGAAKRAGDADRITALYELKKGIEEAMDETTEAAGTQAAAANRAARAAAAKRFQQLDAVPALKAVAEGDIAPDDFMRKFVSNGKDADLRSLKNWYGKNAPEVWDQVRGQALDDIYQSATNGGDKFLVASYNKSIESLRKTGKLRILFSPDEINQLNIIGRAGRLIEGPQDIPRTGLLGAAQSQQQAADSLAKIISRLGSLKLGFVADAVGGAVKNAPGKRAVKLAQSGGAMATPLPSRPVVNVPDSLKLSPAKASQLLIATPVSQLFQQE